MKLNRRGLLTLPMGWACAAWAAESGGSKVKLALNTGTSPRLLRLAQQLGVKWADMGQRPLGLIPAAGNPPKAGVVVTPWTAAHLSSLQSQVAAAGLKIAILPLHAFPNAILANKDRDRDIDAVRQSIRAAGAAGIPVLEYNWFMVRASAGYYETKGRGGVGLRAFDYARVANAPVVEELASLKREQIFARLAYFLKAVVPVAEQAGVRLALHPNDPPVASFRGIPQAVRTAEDLREVVRVIDSPSNGITMDTGVMRETGVDVVSLIREFGKRDRINHVHFRNVKMHKPFDRYTESFLDDGDVDMKAAMQAFVEAGYAQAMVPDHSPHLDNDSEDHLAGWSYAIGYMRALLGGR
jgi:mannonate dehydratase